VTLGTEATSGARLQRLSQAQRRVLFRRMRERGMDPRDLPIVPRAADTGNAAPLTAAQHRLWILERFELGSRFTRIALAVRIEGPLDIAALREALNAVCRRHEALRTTFEERVGQPVQLVHETLPAPFSVIDVQPDADERERRLDDLRCAFEDRPFDSAREAPLRAQLVTLSERESILLVVLHHLVADGWSVDVVARELSRAYARGRAVERRTESTPAPLQLVDYAWWERDMRDLGKQDDDLAAFAQALAGAPDESTFPADLVRPPVRSSRAGLVSFALAEEAAAQLCELAARAGTTLFSVLCACTAVVLRRFAGQRDLVLGTVAANRERPELHELVGMLANALPIRVAVDDEERFDALLARVSNAVAGALSRQRVPLEDILEIAGVRRDPARTPLFQVSVILQNANRASFDVPGLRCTPLPARTAGAMQDVTFVWTESGRGLTLDVEFAAEAYRADSIRAVAGALLETCRAVAREPHAAVADLARPRAAPHRPALRKELLRADASFARWAVRHPDAPAIVSQDVLSYAGLARRSAALATAVRPRGTNAPVGVFVDDGTSAAIAMLGIHRAGAAFVMLDPRAGALHNRATLDDAGIRVLVVSEATMEAARELDCPTIVLDGSTAGELAPDANLAEAGGERCYLAYTSGSTGPPKGIGQSHLAFAQFLAWQKETFAFGPGSRVAMWSPLVFDACYTEVYGALASGAELHVPDYARRIDPRYVARWLAERAVTYYLTVPSFLRLLLEAIADGVALPALADVAVSGETLATDLVQRFRSLLPHVRLHNLYGPTESILATHLRVERAYDANERVEAGREITGREVLVLDESLRPLPNAALGELAIRSEFLTDGYSSDPVATRARYVSPGDARSPRDRLYLTGDLGRRLASGMIEFLGRRDRQVKIRGCRVEPDQVERVVAEHPAVAECSVDVRAVSPHEPALAAYVVAARPVSADELLAHVRARLPAYAVPSFVVFVPALPRTTTGKVDWRALPPPSAQPTQTEAKVPGETEERIARIWGRVLGSHNVARDRNFFDAGGTSIAAVALHSALDAEFPGAFKVLDIFIYPTVAQLAAAVQGPERDDTAETARERARRRRAAVQSPSGAPTAPRIA